VRQVPQDNSDLLPLFAAAGQKYGIDPTLLMAVAKQESGLNPNTPDSYQGAQGLMQLLPSTARGLGVTDPRDPAQAIPAAAAYLRQGFDATGTPQGAIAYYHGGPDTKQWGPKTRAYVPAVASHYVNMKSREKDPYADIADEALKALSPPAPATAPQAATGVDPHEAIADEALTALGMQPKAPGGDNSGQESIRQSVADQVAGKIAPPAAASGVEAKALENIKALPGNIAGDTAAAYRGGENMAYQGAANTLGFNPRDPSTWGTAALGVGQTALGGLGMAFSPLSGLTNTLVVDPVTNATGSPAIGEKAGIVAGAALPGLVAGGVNRLAAGARPISRAGEVANPLVTAEAAARLQSNPNLSLMDVSPGARDLATGLAVNARSPSAQNIVAQAIEARKAGAGDMVKGALDASLGPQPDVPALLAGMKQTAAQNAATGFGQALGNAKPVNLNNLPLPYVEKINSTMKQLADSNPNFSLLSPAEQLHRVQSELGAETRTLGNSASGSDRLAAKGVANVREALVDRIDTATGGKFKPAQKQYADDLSIQDAFDKGQTIFKNAVSDIENRPDYWRNAVAQMKPSELDALKLGVRTAADGVINGMRGAAKTGGPIGDVPFNQAKLEAVLGKNEASKLVQKLQDARDMATTNNQVTGGSMTANKQQGAQATAVRDPGGLAFTGGLGLPVMSEIMGSNHLLTAALAGANTLKYGAQQAGRLSDVARNAELARVLTAPGMSGINRLNAPISPLIPYQLPIALGAINELVDPARTRRINR
jgi:hypothetical protein